MLLIFGSVEEVMHWAGVLCRLVESWPWQLPMGFGRDSVAKAAIDNVVLGLGGKKVVEGGWEELVD